MQIREWTLRESISRLLAGAATGCGLLFAFDFLVLFPHWGPRILKGDERWEIVFLIAQIGLPAAIVIGALAALAWRQSREVRLSRATLIGCCLAVALMSKMLRPVVSRIQSGGIGPMYEVIPDILAVSFGVGALAVAVWRIGPQSPKSDAEPNASADSEFVP